jgi:NAD(P)H-quinone oxidoreductase subunit 5
MQTPLALVPLAAPAALLAVALLARAESGRSPHRVLRAASAASVVSLAAAAAAWVLVALHGTLETPLLGVAGLGLSVRVDGLSAAMFALVATLGAAVLRYSRAYLAGDARHGAFLGGLAATIASVMLLVLSGNLVQLVALWAATSLALHRLLLFYPERPAAVVAARKKFVAARAGDVALVAAAVLLVREFGTGDLGVLAARVAEGFGPGGAPIAVHAAAILVGLSAALKSAQFPTWGWLFEVMETPTPVSALLHAGILNGGIFLVARLGGVMAASEPALALLVLVGGTTALLASIAMVTQTQVKGALAASSAAHMGFMLFACGLGAYPAAILHLVAHSFYKAHAFLSSGSAVEVARASAVAGGRARPGAAAIGTGFALAVATVAGTAALLGYRLAEEPVLLGLSAVLAIGLTQLLAHGAAGRAAPRVLGASVLAGAATTVAFFVLEKGAAHALGASVLHGGAPGTATALVMAAMVALFAAAMLFQLLLPRLAQRPRWAALWVHARNGFYANARFDRLVGSLAPLSPEVRR